MKLIFAGDVYVSEERAPKLSNPLIALLASADVVCLNLEAPICNENISASKKIGPAISQHPSVVQLVKTCGATHINLANNHIMDFGEIGLAQTIKGLEGMSCFGAGTDFESAYKPQYVEIGDKRVALLAFAETQFGALVETGMEPGGFACFDHPWARAAIAESKRKADYVIVQVHAGLEMVDIPLPELRCRYRELIDIGADIIIGHHPHVIQGTESYKGKEIHYSIGNFYMDLFFDQPDPGSGALLEVIVSNEGLTSRLVPLGISSEYIDIDTSGSQSGRYKEHCRLLDDGVGYISEVNRLCEKFFQEVYEGYYEIALNGVGMYPNFPSIKRVIRRIIGLMLGRKRSPDFNELLLLHNIRIETHRWVVQRALMNRIQK